MRNQRYYRIIEFEQPPLILNKEWSKYHSKKAKRVYRVVVR